MRTTAVKTSQSIQELLFIIAPPRHIASDVAVLKDDVQYLIGHEFEDRYAPAHISLFKYADEHIDEIIEHVEAKAAQFKAFNVFIKNLNTSYLNGRRIIHLDIINKYPIREIFEKTVKEDANFTPRLVIARNLGDEDFLKSWPYLKDLPYSQHFLCDRITVLARTENRWAFYRDIQFSF